jgi:iron(III) transport system substrate-binding protein
MIDIKRWVIGSQALLLTFAVSATSTLQAGPEEQWKKTLEAANREGKLTLMMHINPALAKVAKDFDAKYPGIKVDDTLANVARFAPKVITEQRNGQYLWDVAVIPTSNAAGVMTPAGVFQDMPPLFILSDAMESRNWHGGFEMWANNKSKIKTVFISSAYLSGGLGVNRDVISTAELSRVDRLLDPKWRGKIVIDEPSVPRLGSLALSAMLATKGPGFVKDLFTKQQPVYTRNPRLMMEWFATGRYPLVITERAEILRTFKNAGVVKSTELIPPRYLSTWGIAAFKNPPHPNAAKVFVNWFLSREGQEAYAKYRGATGGISRRVDVASRDPDHTPDWKKLNTYVSPGRESDIPLVRQVMKIYKSTK